MKKFHVLPIAVLLLCVACSSNDGRPEGVPAPKSVDDIVSKHFDTKVLCSQYDTEGTTAFIEGHPSDPHAGPVPEGSTVYGCSAGPDDHSGVAVAILNGKVVRWAD